MLPFNPSLSLPLSLSAFSLSPRHDGVARRPPVAVDRVQVAVAHAGVRDLDEHVRGAELAALELVRREHRAGVARRPAEAVGVGGAVGGLQRRGLVERRRKLLKLDLVCGWVGVMGGWFVAERGQEEEEEARVNGRDKKRMKG